MHYFTLTAHLPVQIADLIVAPLDSISHLVLVTQLIPFQCIGGGDGLHCIPNDKFNADGEKRLSASPVTLMDEGIE